MICDHCGDELNKAIITFGVVRYGIDLNFHIFCAMQVRSALDDTTKNEVPSWIMDIIKRKYESIHGEDTFEPSPTFFERILEG